MNLLALIPIVALLQTANPPAAPKVGVQLYTAHGSVQPGGQTELAIEVNVEKGWHAYHPLILDTGAPTLVSIDAPSELTFGELRFPTPALVTEADMQYLSLDGRFQILTTVKAAADAKPGNLPIKVKVHALVCKELCVMVDLGADTTLKIAAQPAAPANEELFKKARAALPSPFDKAKYVEGSRVSITPDVLTPDGQTMLTVDVKVKAGHHIQDRDPGTKELIPARLFIEKLDGVKFGDPVWPEPKTRDMPGFGRVREQRGEFQIKVPVSLDDEKFASGPIALRVLFTYQTCTDAGTCFPPETAEGVVRFTAKTPNPALASALPRGTLYPEVTAIAATGSRSVSTGSLAELLLNLVLAFFGGMIFNITPCVFPVISIKIVGFVKQAGEDRGRVFRLGLVFCAGIMAWFWIFGILTSVGQVPLQHPPVAIGMTALLFVLALNLFGVFEIVLPGAAADKLGEAASREGYPGAFMKGLLATLLGTACTAPFFVGAAAYASTKGGVVAFLVFTAAGLGMSTPYLLLSAYPGWLKWLPKPGPWMVTFKQVMGFILVATIVWLLRIVGDLVDVRGLVMTLAFLTVLAFSAWLVGRIKFSWGTASRLVTWVAALAVAGFGGWLSLSHLESPTPSIHPLRNPESGESASSVTAAEVARTVEAANWSGEIPWQTWQPGLPEALSKLGYTVYVDFTATWCASCQANKATSLEIDSIRTKMKSMRVIPLLGDFTKRNPVMLTELLKYGHNSVPLNLVYPAGKPDEPIKLAVILTPGLVSEALDKAGPSQGPAAAAEGDSPASVASPSTDGTSPTGG